MEWSVPNLYHTTHSTLERTRQLTRPFWYCQELYPKNSMITHKNAKGANQQPALHCFFCWDEHHVYSLTFVTRISEGQSHRLCQGNAKLFLVFRWKQKRVALQLSRKIHFKTVEPGEIVFVRNLSDCGGPGKRKAYWEEQIHVMVERGEPVYEVYPAGNDREKRVLHKNLLLPYAFLPITQQQNSRAGYRTWSTAKISVKAHRVSQISSDSKSDNSKIPTC